MIEKFSVSALRRWRLWPLEINCPRPRGSRAGLQFSLEQELPAPQSHADPCQPSQAPLTLTSASKKRDGSTALSQATRNTVSNCLGLVLGQGSNQKCVLLREKLPVISGVGIVCRGAENESVKSELVLLVASALNIGTNKIYITEAS